MLALARPARVVIELGTIKSLHPKARLSYGYSTLAWLKLTDGEVHSVDNDRLSIARSRLAVIRLFGPMPKRLHYHEQDGVEFLQKFEQQIDLLYLDGPGREGSKECVRTIATRMLPGSVLLMDDCDIDGAPPLDGRRQAAWLAQDYGFTLIQDSHRQCLLQKRV